MKNPKIPTPPRHSPTTHAIEQRGLYVCYLWAFDGEGAAQIESQYSKARDIMRMKGVSQATAYRIIARHTRRYWYVDMSSTPARVWAVLPTEIVQQHNPAPRGNPNLRSGIYQQDIAKRRRNPLDRCTK